MIPTNNTADTLTELVATFGDTPLFDFDTGCFVLRDGRPVMASYDQAIEQWARMLLSTENGKFPIYDGFGVSLYQFIGRRDLPVGVVDSEIRRQVTEQMLQHPEIVSVTSFETERTPKGAKISFTILSKRGTTQRMEAGLLG
ncbi:DUF2634 domain-containing protein [Paenibacillus sp. MAH-36]|uniref:DUF2634 domain-containing protein n=1 Tax=Paenibacillus violae TaxID=3077234 RepID=A0ABU3R7C8_9BACL|nr:DUF2634 domain-containing protein [Paenibacillus sp. PFR10]MDU0200170.1 DUF2634 domain-containing protein [Paenibacillus sp. PFR10]